MTTQEQYIARLIELVEARYGNRITTMEECNALAKAVEEAIEIRLDGRTLAPLFLSPKHRLAPRPVVLSALTQYIGMGSWSDFCASRKVIPADDTDVIPTTRRWGVVILTCVAIVVVVAATILLLRSSRVNMERHTQSYATIVSRVEEQWVARTIEECNAMRAHCDSEMYDALTTSFITAHDNMMDFSIPTDLRAAFAAEGIEVSNSKVEEAAQSIHTRCITICEGLYID